MKSKELDTREISTDGTSPRRKGNNPEDVSRETLQNFILWRMKFWKPRMILLEAMVWRKETWWPNLYHVPGVNCSNGGNEQENEGLLSLLAKNFERTFKALYEWTLHLWTICLGTIEFEWERENRQEHFLEGFRADECAGIQSERKGS